MVLADQGDRDQPGYRAGIDLCTRAAFARAANSASHRRRTGAAQALAPRGLHCRSRCRKGRNYAVRPRSSPVRRFELPPFEILEPATSFPVQEHEAQVNARAMLLERTLLDFGYQVRVVQIDTGPVITQFEIELEAGLRVSKIMSLADDLAIALAVPSVRIVAPIPSKTTVGIEVPNDHRNMVRLGEVMAGIAGTVQGMPDPAVPRQGRQGSAA